MDALLRQVRKSAECEHTRVGMRMQSHCEEQGQVHVHPERTVACPLLNLELYFYKPRPDDYAINRAVAYFTQQRVGGEHSQSTVYSFAHVELCFSYNPCTSKPLHNENYSFSIAQGTNVYLRRRERWRCEYMAVAIPVQEHEYRALWARCHSLASAAPPIGFDKLGMYLAFVAPAPLLTHRTDETHGTFCSKIVLRVLKECNMFSTQLAALHPSTATPTQLFCALRPICIPSMRVGAC